MLLPNRRTLASPGEFEPTRKGVDGGGRRRRLGGSMPEVQRPAWRVGIQPAGGAVWMEALRGEMWGWGANAN
jgi:hypothetical protein